MYLFAVVQRPTDALQPRRLMPPTSLTAHDFIQITKSFQPGAGQRFV